MGNLAGEIHEDQGLQAECHTRESGPEGGRGQGRSMHGSDLPRCAFRGQEVAMWKKV